MVFIFCSLNISINLNNVIIIILIEHSSESSIFSFLPSTSFPVSILLDTEKFCLVLRFYIGYHMADTSQFLKFFASKDKFLVYKMCNFRPENFFGSRIIESQI